MPNLEILIPVYNDFHGLIKTLSSIDSDDFSVIIVDDGSLNPIDISDFKNLKSRTKLITLEKNSGIIKALNTGLDSMSKNPPEFVFRIDAGDVFSPDGIRERLKIIKDDKLGILGGSTEFIDQKSGRAFVYDRKSESPSKLFPLITNYIHSGVIFKYTKLRYNPSNKYCEDVFLFKKIEDLFGGKRVITKYRVKVFQGISGISTEKRELQLNSFIKAIRRNKQELHLVIKTLALAKLFLIRVFLKRKSKEILLKSLLNKKGLTLLTLLVVN